MRLIVLLMFIVFIEVLLQATIFLATYWLCFFFFDISIFGINNNLYDFVYMFLFVCLSVKFFFYLRFVCR